MSTREPLLQGVQAVVVNGALAHVTDHYRGGDPGHPVTVALCGALLGQHLAVLPAELAAWPVPLQRCHRCSEALARAAMGLS